MLDAHATALTCIDYNSNGSLKVWQDGAGSFLWPSADGAVLYAVAKVPRVEHAPLPFGVATVMGC